LQCAYAFPGVVDDLLQALGLTSVFPVTIKFVFHLKNQAAHHATKRFAGGVVA
jgi:hypothetical protein